MATWYENRDLDYYNYSDARGVEGGGRCGAWFDAGNCASIDWEMGVWIRNRLFRVWRVVVVVVLGEGMLMSDKLW
jgi:hypothetical protein